MTGPEQGLEEFLGEDVTILKNSIHKNAFQLARKNIRRKHEEGMVAKAEERISACIDLYKQLEVIEKELNSKISSTRKKLQKALNALGGSEQRESNENVLENND